jgi:transposase-like protein
MTKFSKDFRVKLVMDVDRGEALGAIAQKYGVGRATLQTWHLNYSRGGVSQLISSNQRYTQEFKIYAIDYRWQNDLSYMVAAAELEIPNGGVLYQWEKRFLEFGVTGLQTTKKGRPPKVPKKQEEPKRELTRQEQLETEIAQLRMENAYLKKLNALVKEREKSKRKTK